MASTEFSTRSHRGAGFLFLFGLALIALGAGFAFAPHYSWQVTKIARQATALGMQNGALVVGGLVVLGLGLVARLSGGSAPSHDYRGELEALQSEYSMLNEQVSSKLAQLRTSLMQVHESVMAVSANQQAQQQVESVKAPGNDHSQDAIFRLAASLDQLHAHLDERVHAVDLQLRSGFEALLNASHDVRRHLGQGGVAATGFHPAATGFQPSARSQASVAPHASHAQGESQAPVGGIDFFETMQKLDAIAGGDTGEGLQAPRHPNAPFPSQGRDESLDALMPEEYRDRY